MKKRHRVFLQNILKIPLFQGLIINCKIESKLKHLSHFNPAATKCIAQQWKWSEGDMQNKSICIFGSAASLSFVVINSHSIFMIQTFNTQAMHSRSVGFSLSFRKTWHNIQNILKIVQQIKLKSSPNYSKRKRSLLLVQPIRYLTARSLINISQMISFSAPLSVLCRFWIWKLLECAWQINSQTWIESRFVGLCSLKPVCADYCEKANATQFFFLVRKPLMWGHKSRSDLILFP